MSGTAPAQRDRLLYAAAARADSAEPCEGIGDDVLRDECFAHAGACDQVKGERQRSECAFLAGDARGAVGEDARRLCASVAPFTQACLAHATDRDLRARVLPEAIGDEVALLATIQGVLDDYAPSEAVPEDSPAHAYLAAHLATRFADRDFDPALCGVASRADCRRAYRHSALSRVSDVEAVCETGADEAVAVAAGAAGWTDAGDEVARAAWDRLCDAEAKTLFRPR